MKKEKIIFAFVIFPFLLFPANLKHFRFEKAKKPNPPISQEKTNPINKNKTLSSKLEHITPTQDPVKPKSSLSEQELESLITDRRAQKIREIRSVFSDRSRPDRARKQRPDRSRPQIRSINEGRPFRLKGEQYVQDQVLVKFKPTLSDPMVEVTLAAYRSKKLKRIPRLNIYQLQIPEGTTVEEMLYVLSRNPDVEYAEPNYRAHITVTPNDILFSEQYALYNSGQEFGPVGSPQQGQSRADIKAREAWEETKGDEDIIIAIVDSGVDMDHPDINDKIQSSGRDFVNDDFDATDDLFHGTHVAGIAAAETNNEEGIAGVAWNSKILPVKVIDDTGWGDYADIIDGIRWAADNGADVINLSVGGDVFSLSLREAVKYAYDNNIVVVCAAGNDGGSVLYPAAYEDYCLAVAATDYDDLRVSWSNYGPEVDIAAPGDQIISLVPTWYWGPDSLPYAYGDGTSMAAPHVSGLAALIKGLKPNLSVDDIMYIIRYSADDVNSTNYLGEDEFIGYGRINMEKALVPIIITTKKITILKKLLLDD